MLAAVEDSGSSFDEQLRVETGAYWVHGVLGSRPPLRRVRVTEQDLEIDGRSTPRDQILAVTLVPEKDPPCVVIVARSRQRITIELPAEQEGVRLRAALGHEINRENKPNSVVYRGAKINVNERKWFVVIGCVILLYALTALVFGPQKPFSIFIGGVSLYLLMRPLPRITVGRDGISISRMFLFSSRPRYISFRDVVAVTRYGNPIHRGITLELGNEILDVPLGRVRDGGDEVSRPLQEIRDALAAWRNEQPTEDSDALLRSGRDTRQWISSLKELGGAEGAIYRVASIEREKLFAIAEDPANEAVSRAAAAIALGAALEDEERVRLGTTAKTIADPRLRIAWDHVIEKKSDDDLEAILDDLDPVEDKIR